MRRRVLLCLTLIAMSACNGDRVVQPTASPTTVISDATHPIGGVAGNPDFFFLPPMVKNPSASPQWNAGAFNANVHPTVEICAYAPTVVTEEAVNAGAPCTVTASFAASLDAGDEQYHVNWKVPTSNTVFFRIAVKVGAIRLGFADVETGSNAAQLKNVATGDFIPLVDGRTLPVKFRIERYALCETPGTGPCNSATVSLETGGTVYDVEGTGGVILPAQGPGFPPEITVTVAGCENFNPRVTDLPTFGPCRRITTSPELVNPLTNRATVFNCTVNVSTVVAQGLTHDQAERITLHQLDDDGEGQVLRAVPHTEACEESASSNGGLRGVFASLSHGRFGAAARQMASMLSPKPLYAARFIDLGGGGLVEFFSDFQFALPAKLEILSGNGQTALPGTLLPDLPTVKVTDLDGRPVAGARVTFATTDGSVQPTATSAACPAGSSCTVVVTASDGLANTAWTLRATAGANTLRARGRGLGGTDASGPREGVDPFQPIQALHAADPLATAVVVRLGSVAFSATGVDPTGTISGTIINAFTNQPLGGVTVTATSTPTGMATEAIDFAAVSTTTAANGQFVIANVPAGVYDVSTALGGFVSASRTSVVVVAGANTPLGIIGTAPVTSEGNIRIVLDWGACSANNPPGTAPCDLDSHLTGPTATGSRFHVYYAARTFSDPASAAVLDLDDVTGLGPETITLSRQAPGEYHYYVHDYSQYSSGGPAVTVSSARVRVFFGASSAPTATYFVPLSGTGALWDVFALNGTTLTAVNLIRTVANPAVVGASASRIPLAGATMSSTGTPSTTDADLQRIAEDIARAVKAP